MFVSNPCRIVAANNTEVVNTASGFTSREKVGLLVIMIISLTILVILLIWKLKCSDSED